MTKKFLVFLFTLGFLISLGSTLSYSQYWFFINQYEEKKLITCNCPCVMQQFLCTTFYCLPEKIPKKACTIMFRDDCTTGGFGDPCIDFELMCEALCAPP